MNVEINRTILIMLARDIVTNISKPNIENWKYEAAYQRREFINGFHYRLSNDWLEKQTDEELLAFVIHCSPNIKPL